MFLSRPFSLFFFSTGVVDPGTIHGHVSAVFIARPKYVHQRRGGASVLWMALCPNGASLALRRRKLDISILPSKSPHEVLTTPGSRRGPCDVRVGSFNYLPHMRPTHPGLPI